ncbi:high affinity nitrate transporter 2.5-like [Chenopodium quinoa]|uniref:high affinity nitrate transporter 2.5-like n=1 Tax=Chenopodium quinoa TaxID=63459 RepID=UPI000B7703AC|nr:high affinity nitrate transporter 2.5-like [Chenopodium quinoa]
MMASTDSVKEFETNKFSLPVDAEHKATTFSVMSVAKPHMRAFHLSWLQFFACFLSTFAAPPLLPIICDSLNLTATDIGNAGIASVSGAVFARLVMGTACDLVGPRIASAALTLLTAPAVYLSATANSPTAFLLIRFFTGFSLATFVSTQFWMSSMFSPPVVGRANSIAAGWGNLGGGATQMIMPLLYTLILGMGATNFTAWRIAFFIPAVLQTLLAFAVLLFGQDMPDGNFQQLHNSGKKHKDNLSKVMYHGLANYRGWITALCYGYCFGVELTVDNIIAQYFFDRFNLKLHTAGIIAASFGLANIFARPGGGLVSDLLAKKFGMRGRLWGWWIIQTVGGVLCILLGLMNSLSGSIAVMFVFSVFVQAACGLAFGVVPFVSRRSLGVISGMTGAGGNVGAVLTQLIFFKGSQYTTERGITYMGIMIVACTLPISAIYFPQWGGMFCGPNPNTSENDYYMEEWDLKEQQEGHHLASLRFADSSKSERCRRQQSAHPNESLPSCVRLIYCR